MTKSKRYICDRGHRVTCPACRVIERYKADPAFKKLHKQRAREWAQKNRKKKPTG